MKITLRTCVLTAALAASAFTLAACSDGYTHSSYSVGVTSGQRGGAYGDRDLDGVPNAFDRRPANPYRD